MLCVCNKGEQLPCMQTRQLTASSSDRLPISIPVSWCCLFFATEADLYAFPEQLDPIRYSSILQRTKGLVMPRAMCPPSRGVRALRSKHRGSFGAFHTLWCIDSPCCCHTSEDRTRPTSARNSSVGGLAGVKALEPQAKALIRVCLCLSDVSAACCS